MNTTEKSSGPYSSPPPSTGSARRSLKLMHEYFKASRLEESIAATIIQFALSKGREFGAGTSGAKTWASRNFLRMAYFMCKDPIMYRK